MKKWLLVVVVCVLMVCSSGGESKIYYQLLVVQGGVQSVVSQGVCLLWVEQVSILDYLVGNGVVYQIIDVQYVIVNNNLWVSLLDQQLCIMLVVNFSQQLFGWVVLFQLLGSEQDIFNVVVNGFYGCYDGWVIVSGEWLLKYQGQLIKCLFNIVFRQEQDGYDVMVKILVQVWSQEVVVIVSEFNCLL